MDDTGDEIRFLTMDEVQIIHTTQLELYGGMDGYIDRNVVESGPGVRAHFSLMYKLILPS